MKLIYWPNPILKQVSEPTKVQIQSVFDDMYAIMKAHNGVGLSAIQVGLPMRFFILDVGAGMEVFVNPKIESTSGELIPMREGCLSLPGWYEDVKRYPQVTVSYDDGEWKRQSSTYDGLRAHAVQHEMEHLDGKMFVDRLTGAKRSQIMGMMQKLLRQGKLK